MQSLSLEQYETYEKQRMQKNAWHVSEIVKERIDDAPVLGTFLICLLAEKNEQNNLFFNTESPNIYLTLSTSKKDEVPGSMNTTK